MSIYNYSSQMLMRNTGSSKKREKNPLFLPVSVLALSVSATEIFRKGMQPRTANLEE